MNIKKIKRTLRPWKKALSSWIDNRSLDYPWWLINHSPRLLKFEKFHEGEDCFIIGNGPSLNKIDLSPLRHYHTFGLNKIYLIFDKVDLSLSYHVAVNTLVIEQSYRQFESLNCPSFLSYIPAKKVIKNNQNIYYIFSKGPFTFYEDLLDGVCEGFTVTYVAMQIAFFMGFKRVFLIGVDHSFKYLGKPNEKQLLEGNDPNHFSSIYFSNKDWNLPDLEGSEAAYNLAKFYFKKSDREIFDATVDGKLDIFPKISYQEALAICKQKD